MQLPSVVDQFNPFPRTAYVRAAAVNTVEDYPLPPAEEPVEGAPSVTYYGARVRVVTGEVLTSLPVETVIQMIEEALRDEST
uniref:Uncharacterized protein n=2 Tax=unclassified bacterial viruses TaxID=12333 RepID=A0AAU7J7P9_9VIRU